MTSAYLWVKSFHIVMVTSWFAGLFYLPRIYVNLAQVSEPGAERDRLLGMSRRLWRFMQPLMWLALVLGLVLWLYYGVGAASAWMHLKLIIVVALVIYHFWCGRILAAFERREVHRSHVWFRWFNELPVLALLGAVLLVVLKPFQS